MHRDHSSFGSSDSFGPEVLSRLGVVFTRAYGDIEPQQDRGIVQHVVDVVAGHTGLPVTFFPFWQIDSNVSARRGVTPEFVAQRTAEVKRATDECVRWSLAKPPMQTLDFKVGEYAETKRIREATAAAEAADARAAEAARAQREAEQRADQETAARAAAQVAQAQAEAAAARAEAAAAAKSKGSLFSSIAGVVVGVVGAAMGMPGLAAVALGAAAAKEVASNPRDVPHVVGTVANHIQGAKDKADL